MATTSDAHSKMILPKPTWDPSWGTNSPSGTIDGPNALTVPTGMSFATDSASGTKAYTAVFKAQTKYGSLRDLVFATQTLESGASQECGFSLVNGTAQPLPDVVEWDGLTSSHQGPCEVWCDDVLAFSDENCATNYPENQRSSPMVYLNCAPLSGATTADLGLSTSLTAATAVTTAPSASSASLTSSYSSDDEYATPTPSSASTSASEAADVSTTTAALYSDGSLDVTSTGSSEASAGESSSAASASISTSTSTTSASSSSTPTSTSKCKAKTTRRRRRN